MPNVVVAAVAVPRAGISDTGYKSFDDLESGPLPVARSRAAEQRPNSVNRLAIAPDHTPDIALTQLHFEDGRSSTRNFRQHHVVWKLNELSNHELEKFFHPAKANHESAFAQSYGVTSKPNRHEILFSGRKTGNSFALRTTAVAAPWYVFSVSRNPCH